ncbi:MAG: type II toxin-antitoxin system ParD family antitoxin [Gemmatimonadetes bacterium]|nr:type II toxin-antitoxin system ParD family antitoxin [Gemmatimonadota bacterium]
MNVNLTPELDRLVRERVKSGMYGSTSEVVREALRRMLFDEPSRPDRVAEDSRPRYRDPSPEGLLEKMERIWETQRARGHTPPNREEVDERIREARKGWG